MAEIPGLSPPIVYVVAFSSDDDVDADYSPIVTGTEVSADGSTFPQLLSREIVPALPALWYCLHLPKTVHDLVDIPLTFMPGFQALARGHNLVLLPVAAVRRVFTGRLGGWPRTLLIGPDSERAELNRLASDLDFRLPATVFSQLSESSLHAHWDALKGLLADSLPGPPGPDLQPVRVIETAGIELPTRRLMRQLGIGAADLPPDPVGLFTHAMYAQVVKVSLAKLEAEGCTVEEAEARMPGEMKDNAQRLRLPMTIGLPGAAPKHVRRYGAPAGDSASIPRGSDSTWPGHYDDARDAEIERSAAALLVTYQAVAQDSVGVLLPDCPPDAFSALAELEAHCARGARPAAVWRLLDRLDAAMKPVWTDPMATALERASALIVIGSFPIGLCRPPGLSAPLSCLLPISYRPLIPMTRSVPTTLFPVRSAELNDGFKVLVAECIPADDHVGMLSRTGWAGIAEMFSPGDPRSTMVYQETLSVAALGGAIAEHAPDVLVISAHGFSRPDTNVAGIMIGHERSLGIDIGPLPPLVILSACHVAPRGTGSVTVADLLLREGAIAVLGTLVPVDVVHNATLMNRLFLYMTLVLAGEADHGSFREVWHRVQMSNAVHDVTSGNPRTQEWFMSRTRGGPSPQELFKNERSTGRIRPGHAYQDTESVLLEIADEFGDADRVRGWLRGQGYVPESALYCLLGDPDRIYLQSIGRRLD